MREPIAIPTATRARLEKLLQAQQATHQMYQAQIDSTIATVREVLDVPSDYTIAALDVGFVPPEAKENPA